MITNILLALLLIAMVIWIVLLTKKDWQSQQQHHPCTAVMKNGKLLIAIDIDELQPAADKPHPSKSPAKVKVTNEEQIKKIARKVASELISKRMKRL